MANASNIKESATEIKVHESAANSALQRGPEGVSDFIREKAALENAVERYNSAWIGEQYEAFMKKPNPMVAAIEKLTVDQIAIRTTKDKATGMITGISVKKSKSATANVVEKDIDIADFEDWALEAGYPRVSVNSQWRYQVERFNYIMCIRAGLDMSGEAAAALIRNNFKLSADARATEMVNPASNKEAVKVLQGIVDQIIFIDSGKKSKEGDALNTIKVDERDLKYIKYLMCNRGTGLHVGLSKDSTMRLLITKAINKNMTARDYAFDYESESSEPKAMPGFTVEETKKMVAEEEKVA